MEQISNSRQVHPAGRALAIARSLRTLEVPTLEEEIERGSDALGVLRSRVSASFKSSPTIMSNRSTPSNTPRSAPRCGDGLSREPSFAVPAARDGRPMSASGTTSLHFKHRAVSKLRGGTLRAGGVVLTAAAAGSHVRYVARDGAVAELGLGPAVVANEHGSRFGESDPELVDAEPTDTSAPDTYLRYMTDKDAVANVGDTRLIFTNLRGTITDQAQFFERVVAYETEPGPDMVAITPAADRAWWDTILRDPACPAEVAQALSVPGAPEKARLRIAASDPAELIERLGGFGQATARPSVTFSPGRGGRVQNRIEAELPAGLPYDLLANIAQRFCEEFERRKLSYVATIHAPDHKNASNNPHLHLVYYDRPVELMPDSRYDFEHIVVVKDATGRDRRRRLDQPKYRQASSRGWTKSLRQKFVKLCNEELAAAGAGQRLHADRNEEVGIKRQPMSRMGPNLAALDRYGVATKPGTRNGQIYWDDRARALRDDYLRQRHAVIDEALALERRHDRLHVRMWRTAKLGALNARYAADVITLASARARSRAEVTREKIEREVAGIRAQPQESRERRRLPRLGDRHRSASDYLAATERMMAPHLALSQAWLHEADEHDGVAHRNRAALAKTKRREVAAAADIPVDSAKASQDAWMQDLVNRRRRLVRRAATIQPVILETADEAMITDDVQAKLRPRLEGLLRRQDALIAELASYIVRHPTALTQPTATRPRTFQSPRPQLVDAYKAYAKEPEVVDAIVRSDKIRSRDRGAANPAPTKAVAAPASTEQVAPMVSTTPIITSDAQIATGDHPKIEAWRTALAKRVPDRERQILAWVARADPQGRAAIQALPRAIAKRLHDDADRHGERLRLSASLATQHDLSR